MVMLTLYDKNDNVRKLSERSDNLRVLVIEESMPSYDYTGMFYVGKNVNIDGITIPQFSRGFLVCESTSDGAGIAIDPSRLIYALFRNNGVWYARKI